MRGGVELGGFLAVVGQAALELLVGALMAQLLVLAEALGEVLLVHLQALLGGQLAGHLDGEAVGVVELEGAAAVQGIQCSHAGLQGSHQGGLVAGVRRVDDGHHVRRGAQLLLLGQLPGKGGLVAGGQDALQQGPGIQGVAVHLVKFLLALPERAGKAALLQLQLLQHEGAVAGQLGIHVLVLVDDHLGHLGGEALGHAQLHAVAHGAADQAAEDIALVGIGGGHAPVVTQDEGGGAHMVGNDAEGLAVLVGGLVLLAGQLLNAAQNPLEQVGFVNALLAV